MALDCISGSFVGFMGVHTDLANSEACVCVDAFVA